MTLDEKIARSINARMEDVLELFQSAENDAGDCQRVLALLKGMLPLIEDIKTEVNQILNRTFQNQDPQEDQDEQPEDPSPDIEREILEKQKLISKEVEKLKQLTNDQKRSPSERKLLPDSLPMITDQVVNNVPWAYLAFTAGNLSALTRELMDNVQQYSAESAKHARESNGWGEYFKQSVEDWFDLQKQNIEDIYNALKDQAETDTESVLNRLRDILGIDDLIKQNTDDIKQDTQDLKNDTNDLKSDTESLLDKSDQMASNMGECCQNMDTKIDRNNDNISEVKTNLNNVDLTTQHIETMVGQLQPSTISNQNLAILSKENAVLAEVQALRGLL